jgi:hypothetical protein
MKGATVKAYPSAYSGPCVLKVSVGDKRRGAITLPGKHSEDTFIDNPSGRQRVESIPDALEFVRLLRDAALEARKEV